VNGIRLAHRWPQEVDDNVQHATSWQPPVDFATLPRLTFERSNRPAAANRAEETKGGFAVAKWNAALRKTGKAMVRNARV
jgi:hypothetical protein